MVAGGHEKNRTADKIDVILGTYDFGVAKLGAGYSEVDTVAVTGPKGKNWNLMATAPFGVFTVKAGYGSMKAEG